MSNCNLSNTGLIAKEGCTWNFFAVYFKKIDKNIFWVFLLFSTPLLASDVIQPKDYTSNNNEYTLSVSPLSPDGLDGAIYTMKKGDDRIWFEPMDVTAIMADVSSNGEVITCSYSQGLEPTLNRDNRKDFGYLQLTFLNADGQTQWAKSIKRTLSIRMHSPPSPYCEQVLIQEHTQRVYIWQFNDQQTKLITVNSKTGLPVDSVDLNLNIAEDLTSVKSMKFHSIDETDLLLVEIIGYIHEKNKEGNGYYVYESDALYYLLDSKGNIHWHRYFKGSLDIRKTTETSKEQKAYIERDAFLKQHDLIRLNHNANQFAITDYNSKKLYWFELTKQHEVKPLRAEDLLPMPTPFTAELAGYSIPKLLQNIDLSNLENLEQNCSQNYDAIDVLSDGSLLLYEENSLSVTKISEGKISNEFITVPNKLIKEQFISQQLMFVGSNDDIYINLGLSHYAVYQADGVFDSVKIMGEECSGYCFQDYVVQKQSGNIWVENGRHGVFQINSKTGQKMTSVHQDSIGQWFDYIYDIQSDEQGRLMMLGRINDAFNQLYVLDAYGKSKTTVSLGHGYTLGATIYDEIIFISENNNDEIAVLNTSGELIGKFETNNGQTPYLLKAMNNKLYVVTKEDVLLYDISEWTHDL